MRTGSLLERCLAPALLLVSLSARGFAAPSAAAPSATAPSATAPSAAASSAATPSVAAAPERVPYRHKPWAIFDPFLSPRENALFGGPSSLRELDQIDALHGASFGFFQTQRETRGFLWLSLERDFGLSIYSKWTFLLELSKYTYLAGVRLGPVEVGAGPGLTPVAVDISDGDPSMGGLCPRATLKLGVKTGQFRFSLRAYREYLWRWLGRDDAWLTGFAFELALETPKRTHWGGHPVVFER